MGDDPGAPLPRLRARRSERRHAALFVAAWAIALLVVWSAIQAVAPAAVPSSGAVRATLLVTGPGWDIRYVASTVNTTAFGLLREASTVLGFELHAVPYEWPYHDVFVASINGTKNDGSQNLWWQYCMNDAYATVGAANQALHGGDVVTWVYAPPGGNELCR